MAGISYLSTADKFWLRLSGIEGVETEKIASIDELWGELYQSGPKTADTVPEQTEPNAQQPVPVDNARDGLVANDASGAKLPRAPRYRTPLVIKVEKDLSKITTVAALGGYVQAFNDDHLAKLANTTLFASGDTSSQLMVIGYKPTREDDETGEFYSGEPGVLLDAALQSIGLSRADVYITYLSPWRPAGDMQVNQEQADFCSLIVHKHIGFAQPKLLLLFGSETATVLLDSERTNSSKPSCANSKWYSYSDKNSELRARVAYEPQHLLKSPRNKRDLWLDLLAIKRELK